MEEIVFKPVESEFVKVKCPKCNNEQVIFVKASTDAECLVCSEKLAKSTGGKAEIKAEIIEKYS